MPPLGINNSPVVIIPPGLQRGSWAADEHTGSHPAQSDLNDTARGQ